LKKDSNKKTKQQTTGIWQTANQEDESDYQNQKVGGGPNSKRVEASSLQRRFKKPFFGKDRRIPSLGHVLQGGGGTRPEGGGKPAKRK